jgi:transposase
MKGMSYDVKFRIRAIEYWNKGHSKRTTAEEFKVSPTTLQTWKSRLNETGNLEATKHKTRKRKIDSEKLREIIIQKPDAFLKEIAEEFECSEVAVLKALRRLNITRKKNHTIQGNGRKNSTGVC